jgi:hypothetical protein
MNKKTKFIKWIVLITFIFIAIFYTAFATGMIRTNSRHNIDKNVASEVTSSVRNAAEALNLKKLDIYYKQGKLYIDLYFQNNISLEETKIAVKSLREALLSDKIDKYLTVIYGRQMSVFLTISCPDNKYYYNSPYNTPDNETNANNSVLENKYRSWYLTDEIGVRISSLEIN